MRYCVVLFVFFFFFQAEDGIRDAQESRGLGDVYKRQPTTWCKSYPTSRAIIFVIFHSWDYFFLIITHISSISILGTSKSFIKFSFTLSQLSAARSNHLRTVGGVIPNISAIASSLIPFMAIFKAKSMTYSSLRRS